MPTKTIHSLIGFIHKRKKKTNNLIRKKNDRIFEPHPSTMKLSLNISISGLTEKVRKAYQNSGSLYPDIRTIHKIAKAEGKLI